MTWQVEPFGGVVALDWEHEGDEWQHHLMGAIRPYGSGGFSMHRVDEPFPHMEMEVRGGKLKSKLWLVGLKEGALLFVTGEGDPADDEIAPWVEAVREAQSRIGQHQEEFAWEAVIGTDPDTQESDDVSLAVETRLGPLSLRPAGVVMTERRPAVDPQLYASTITWSEPVIVSGTDRGYRWGIAQEAAYQKLWAACSLLSVALGRTWVVRDGPTPADLGPRTVPTYVGLTEADFADSGNPQRAKAVEVPEWVDRAWESAVGDGWVRDALAAYLEGSRLRRRHPSVAFVEFVAAIETVGVQQWPVKRCDCCDQCSVRKGWGGAFKKALGLVLDAEQVSELADAYVLRSRTAHAGELHGSETRFGGYVHGSPRFWGSDRVFEFEMQRLYRLADASRRLLEWALRQGGADEEPGTGNSGPVFT